MKLLIYSLKTPTAKIRLPKPFGNKKRRQGAFYFFIPRGIFTSPPPEGQTFLIQD
jgi:hypothetical protein